MRTTFCLGLRALPVSLLAVAMAMLAAPALAQPVELAGVRFEPSLAVAGQSLQLNGAGIRYKAVFKVYAAGLYLSAKANSPEGVLAQGGAKRIHVVMLRDIDANELGRLFTRGMQDNAPREEFAKSLPGTVRMGAIFSAKKRLSSGESFSVDWLPGTGTVVRINGKVTGEPVPEPEFYNGLLRIWLGQSPADPLLKDALLGKSGSFRPGAVDNTGG